MKKYLPLVFVSILLGVVSLSAFMKLINSEKYQVAGEIIPRVETDQKIVALTFDDGPNEYSEDIQKVLREKEVLASFYFIGQNIEQHKESAQKIAMEEHEIGNHSYSHKRMVLKSNTFIAEEVEKTDKLIAELGYFDPYFRPPYGKKLLGLPRYLRDHNKKTITWDVEPLKALGEDASSEEIVEYVKKQTRPGSIILIHPWYGEKNNSRDAIAGIIDALKADGYRFVTVHELLEVTRAKATE